MVNYVAESRDRAGMANGVHKTGLEEAPTGFESGAPLDTYEALYRLVLTAYGYCCAITGTQYEPAVGTLHPVLEVVAIQPREAGGRLQINNYLPLETAAARAFRAGQVLIDDDYRIIADMSVMDAALAARLRPDSYLLLPAEPLFWPSHAMLAYHRQHLLDR